MNVVLDTNIMISAFIFPGGSPELVYRAAIQRRTQLVSSPPLLAEFACVLSDKFDWQSSLVEEAVAQVARIATIVRPKERIAVIADDPADDRVLEAVREGEAEAIVSGDRHLLRLGSWEGTRILKATTLLTDMGIDS